MTSFKDSINSPGDKIIEILDDRYMDTFQLSKLMKTSESFVIDLINGNVKLIDYVAEKLSNALGFEKEYWIELEKSYREEMDKYRFTKDDDFE